MYSIPALGCYSFEFSDDFLYDLCNMDYSLPWSGFQGNSDHHPIYPALILLPTCALKWAL